MKPPPIAALAALTLTLCAPAAAADREGFLIGFTFGAGGLNGCDQCELAAGFAGGLHAGAMVRPRLAVVGELSFLDFAEAPEASGTTTAIGAVQYWPIHWLWVGGGAGIISRTRTGDTGPVAVAQAGIDFRGRKRFGLDLRGRYERRLDEADGDRSVIVLMGFTWY